MGLAALDGNGVQVHIHGAEIERSQSGEMLADATANGIGVVLLLFARGAESAGGSESRNDEDSYGSMQGVYLSRRVNESCASKCVK